MEEKRRHIFSGSIFEELTGSSRAVVVGNQIFVSSTAGHIAETGTLAEGAAAQAKHALDWIEVALKEAGSGLQDIVRLRTYLNDPKDLEGVMAVLRPRVGVYYPALTTLVSALSLPDSLVEIEVDAILGCGAA